MCVCVSDKVWKNQEGIKLNEAELVKQIYGVDGDEDPYIEVFTKDTQREKVEIILDGKFNTEQLKRIVGYMEELEKL